nr:EAL domain-containing protein [Halomonas icarae]
MRLSQARAHELDHAKRQLEDQYRAQASIAREISNVRSLEAVCRMLERQVPGAYCSVMLCDGAQTHFHEAIGPSLPPDYLNALKGVPIGPNTGACGSAAYLGEMVICENLATDSRWENYRDLVKQHRLGACWSFPVLSSHGHLLGTVALYRSTPGIPGDDERRLSSKAVDLAALAIERHLDRQALVNSEKRYRSLFTHHPDAAYSMDLDGKILSLNSQSESLIGLPTEEIIGRNFSHFIETADLPESLRGFEKALSGQAMRAGVRIRDGLGRSRVLDVTNIPMMTDERVTGVFGIAKDITDRKADEARLLTLERSVEASINGVTIVDATQPGMPLIFVNQAFSRITGYGKEEVQGRNCRFLQGPETDPEAVMKIRRSLVARREVSVTLRNYRKNGESFWNELKISPVSNRHGEITHFVGVANDVTQQIEDAKVLAYQASHDDLTGAYNRSMFEERLHYETELVRRQNTLLVVLFIDLDDFKPINDALGHAMGDRLLVAVAERLAEQLGPDDTLGRFGGDEFLALLPRLEDEAQVRAVVDRMLAALTRPFRIDEHDFRLSASIGMASSRELALQSPEQLIVRADSAMYKAKKQGGNTAHWYRHQIGAEPAERVELRRDIQEAIEQHQFSLHYQPLMNSRGEVVGFEALVRWLHPVKGMVSPGAFIPVAEITGQIIPISEWVLGQVCRDLPKLKRLGVADCRVAVNLSPMQFQRPAFLSNLHQRLRESDIPPHWLELEVTEGVLMEDRDAAISILNALRELDISVAIDDFGTGFSSLSYLKSLPVSKVKIDRSFVRDVVTDPSDRAIVKGVISMAQSMGLKVVAEGVETEEQRQYLADQGCDIFQGFLLVKPMPLDKLEAFFTTNA